MDAIRQMLMGQRFSLKFGPMRLTESDHGIHETGVKGDGKIQVLSAFGDAIQTISAVAEGAVKRIKKFDRDIAPDEFELQFGIILSAEYGAVLATMSGEAQLLVKMTYKHDKSIKKGKYNDICYVGVIYKGDKKIGSGFVIHSENRLLVTASHVISEYQPDLDASLDGFSFEFFESNKKISITSQVSGAW